MKINYKKINCEVCYIINETLIGDEEIKDADDYLFCDECQKDLPFYYALKNNAKILLISHLGRPAEGSFEEKFSLKPVAKHLSNIINKTCKLISSLESD